MKLGVKEGGKENNQELITQGLFCKQESHAIRLDGGKGCIFDESLGQLICSFGSDLNF